VSRIPLKIYFQTPGGLSNFKLCENDKQLTNCVKNINNSNKVK
jgi:hypothetical protein